MQGSFFFEPLPKWHSSIVAYLENIMASTLELNLSTKTLTGTEGIAGARVKAQVKSMHVFSSMCFSSTAVSWDGDFTETQ